jgi:hypothetical protein
MRNKEDAKVLLVGIDNLASNPVDKDPILPIPPEHLPTVHILLGGKPHLPGALAVLFRQRLLPAKEIRQVPLVASSQHH